MEVKEDSNQDLKEQNQQPPPPWIESQKEETKEKIEPYQERVSASEASGEEIAAPLQIKKSPFAIFLPLLFLFLLGLGFFFLTSRVLLPLIKKTKIEKNKPQGVNSQVTLTYWGLWEAQEIMEPLIKEYQEKNPLVKINYSFQSYKDYRERLQSALARNEGPDIFRIHNTWIPLFKKDLAAAPKQAADLINFKENFYPLMEKELLSGNSLLAVPLGFDVLALYYNTEIFEQANKTYPSTWDELRRTALELTVRDTSGKIQTAGVALGTANNVDHFSDILGLMMLQNGVNLRQPSGVLAEDALKFYTIFALTDKVWDNTLPPSTYAFATGKVAMIFAPSWRAHEIKDINPQLKFKTAPAPQLPGTKISWASYWVEGVNKQSKNSAVAWDFLAYLFSKETLLKFYQEASKRRAFGEPFPRKDLRDRLIDDPIVGAFVQQMEYAQSWYFCSRTFDNALNDKIIYYLQETVNKILAGESVSSSLKTLSSGVTQVLTQYKIE